MRDWLWAGLSGLIIGFVTRCMDRLEVNPFFSTIAASFLMALPAYLAAGLGWLDCVAVVIIGAGLVACELALHLVQTGHSVTLLARRKLLRSAKLPAMNELMLRDLLVFHGVHIVEGAALESVDAKGVYYEVEGVPALAGGDTVITAVGMEANHALFDAIRDDYETVLALGDGRRVRNIFGAIWDGYEAARSL